MTEIETKIQNLKALYAQQESLDAAKKALIKSILPAEVVDAMAEIEAEFAGKADALKANIQAMEDEVKGDVVENGKTVSVDGIQVVFNKGRVSWDRALLDAYLQEHPKSIIRVARKLGNAYASISRK
jgi:phage host-nuclease inhibitor protein Gam